MNEFFKSLEENNFIIHTDFTMAEIFSAIGDCERAFKEAEIDDEITDKLFNGLYNLYNLLDNYYTDELRKEN